jgi:endonuclease-8
VPEGHTIHRLATDLARDLGGQRLEVSSPQGRFGDAASLAGTRLIRTEAVGKHLFLYFEPAVVHIHLGLFGRFRRSPLPAPEPRGALRLRLVGDTYAWDLRGPTCCEIIEEDARAALLARLGADPLSADADPKPAWQRLSKSSRAIGAVLLDQSIFAGLGNVYRAEILFMLGLHPELPASSLTRKEFNAIWKLARELLARGVKERRIVTKPSIKGRRLRRDEALPVYARRVCEVCNGSIRRWTLGARTVYACETCQPPRGAVAATVTRASARAPSRTRASRTRA